MEFEQIAVAYDKNPIVLIDNSGSTCSIIQKENTTILDIEIKKMKSIMKQKDISDIYLMFWDDGCIFANEHSLINIDAVVDSDYVSSGGTVLGQALKKIPKSWYENKEKCDIYIFTDGELQDKPVDIMRDVLNKACMYIITVENSHTDYNQGNCNAGNAMYETIRSSNLTGKVKEFISFNEHHFDKPFVTFNNPDVPHGYAPFQNKVFKMTSMNKFFDYIDELIAHTEEENILKLTHELSLTVSYLIKNKSQQIQRQIVNLFSDLFANTKGYKEIRGILLDEVDNHIKGKATTFQAYKRNRGKVFEAAQLSLYENVKQSISCTPTKKYTSFIINTKENASVIIKTSDNKVKERIIIGNRIFNHSGLNIDKYNVPVLPLNIELDHDTYDQCVRQWIRANYAKKYNVNAASDLILYYFLADAMRVFISNVSDELKASYRKLVYLMLDRKRFGTDITEYDYLQDNAPESVTGHASKINYIMYKTMKFVGLVQDKQVEVIDEDTDIITPETYSKELPIQPFTFWYGFILLFGDERLIKTQRVFCEPSLAQDKMSVEQLMEFMNIHLKEIHEIDCANMPDYDYTCYITLDNTEETGGYILPPHRLSKNVICSPNMVLSGEGYSSLKANKQTGCPICYTEIDLNVCKFVQPKNIILQEELKQNSQSVPVINEPFYDTTKYDIVNIDETVYKSGDVPEIVKMNECDFNTVAYTINAPHLQEALGTRTIEVKTQEEFNKAVYFKYPFLKDINFENVVLAGGFCRSILLRQRMKDFDFFIHDENNNHVTIFNRLLKDTLTAIKKQHPNVKFLSMYKHLFNVYEVVCVTDPNGFFKEDFTLDNFDKYKFRSLHIYDRNTIIDPETGKVYRRRVDSRNELNETEINELVKNKDFSNYFEDGDITGVRMMYRLQFVLTKNRHIKDIFENFDLYPSCVAFDGNNTYFTKKSEQAYKYMINVVNENNYSTLFDHRLSKYFTYGFTIVLPELNIEAIKNNKVLKLGTNKFNIIQVLDKSVMIEYNSHLLSQIKSVEALEQKNIKEGKSLYKSTLFCSLVSLLRYVKINQVSYIMTDTYICPDENGDMKFQETNENVQFIEKIQSRIAGNDYYGRYRIGASIDVVDKSEFDTDDSDDDSYQSVQNVASASVSGVPNCKSDEDDDEEYDDED